MDIYFDDRISYIKIEGNDNYPNSLNVMVNYHYRGKIGKLTGNSRLWVLP